MWFPVDCKRLKVILIIQLNQVDKNVNEIGKYFVHVPSLIDY